MEIDNKTVLITGVIMLGIIGATYGYEQTLIASISGLVGYLAKDIKINESDKKIGLSNKQSDEDESE